jgi:hypothetical protein
MDRNARPHDYTEALHGLDYPASLSAVHNKVHDKGGLNREVLWIVDHLPDRVYHSQDDVLAEVDRTYETIGPLAGGGLAASPATVKGKRAAETEDASEPSQSGTE